MNRRVYKYNLQVTDLQALFLPKGAKALTAQVQHGNLVLWAEVDPDAVPEMRNFYVVGTGHDIPPYATRYIATVQFNGGSLVFHVYED